MTESTKQAILRGLEADLANAQDNLYRAQCAFRGHDLTELYGESGNTKGSIVADYQEWETRAKTALDEARTALSVEQKGRV